MYKSHFRYNYPDIFSTYAKLYCDPVTLTIVAIGATATAGGMKMYGQYQQGKAQQQMYNYQAGLNVQEAATRRKYAEMEKKSIGEAAKANITIEQTAASLESARLARTVGQLSGKQKATMGALGIGGVTAEDIAVDTFDKSRLDQLAIRYGANLKSWQISEQAKKGIWTLGEETKFKAWSLESEAEGHRVAGRQARKAAKIEMATTLLKTAGTMAFMGSMATPGTPGTPAGGGGTTTLGPTARTQSVMTF